MPGIPLSANFDLGTGIPLDSRLVQADITARNALNTITQRYEGMPVFVVSTGKNYQLRGGVADENWIELIDTGEPALGNPGTNGYILSSTTTGVRSWIAQSSGVVPISDILYWNSGTSKYTPYTAQTSGAFDLGLVAPVHTTRLNYDGYFYVTKLSSQYLFVSDGSEPHLTISAGNASGAAGTDAGHLILKAGNAIYGDADSSQGAIYLVPGNNQADNQAGHINLGDGDSNFQAIFIVAQGSVPNIDIDFSAKGTGEVSFWAGNDITLTAVNGVKVQGDFLGIGYGGLTGAMLSSYNGDAGKAGVHLTVKAGDVGTGGGDWNGGNLYLYGGSPNGTGVLGGIYFGTGSAGKLPSKTSETNVTYYDTSTGKLSYGTISSTQWITTGTDIYYNTGNVGIGTASPLALIHTEGGNVNAARFINNSVDNAALVVRNSGGAGSYGIYADIGAQHYFNGNVGIGTNAPASKFVVSNPNTSAGFSTDITDVQSKAAILTNPLAYNMGLAIANDWGTGMPLIQGILNDNTAQDILLNPYGGNVGIGTTTPGFKLSIKASIIDAIFYMYGRGNGSTQDAHLFLYASEPALTYDGVGISNNWYWNQSSWARYYTGHAASNIRLVGNGIVFQTITTGDVVQTPLSLSGSNVTSSGTMTAISFIPTSDERLKMNIIPLVPLPVKIDYFQFEFKSEPGVIHYGWIAQNVRKDYPEFVREDSEGILSLAYTDIMIKKIAYLEWKIQDLEKKLMKQ